MLITTLVVFFCKEGRGSINLKLWFLVVYVRCEVLCRSVVLDNVHLIGFYFSVITMMHGPTHDKIVTACSNYFKVPKLNFFQKASVCVSCDTENSDNYPTHLTTYGRDVGNGTCTLWRGKFMVTKLNFRQTLVFSVKECLPYNRCRKCRVLTC